MKYKSYVSKKISFEEIRDTPISYLKSLSLTSVLQIHGHIYFFFHGGTTDKIRSRLVGYYMKTDRWTPFRLMEEHVASSAVWKYKSSGKNTSKKQQPTVYRLWGTPYIHEMNSSGIYSKFEKDSNNEVFQIMIITDDETIELINPRMQWFKYNPKNLETIFTNIVFNHS